MSIPKGQRIGGRQKGTPNKSTAAVKAAAQKHTTDALAALVSILRTGQSEQARIAAARELLDRGYGKPAQALTDADGGNLPRVTTVVHVHQP